MPPKQMTRIGCCVDGVAVGYTEASRATLREWLPPVEKLLHIAKFERYWDIHMTGPLHPTLLAATLLGTRLGDWQGAAACARERGRGEGVNAPQLEQMKAPGFTAIDFVHTV